MLYWMRTREMCMLLVIVFFPWTVIGIGHFAHQWFTQRNWNRALDRSFFQGLASFIVVILLISEARIPLK